MLFIAWLNMMIKTLPRALLNSQLKTIARTHDLNNVGPTDLTDHDQRQMPTGDK